MLRGGIDSLEFSFSARRVGDASDVDISDLRVAIGQRGGEARSVVCANDVKDVASVSISTLPIRHVRKTTPRTPEGAFQEWHG